jgi:hypothetical protein
MHILFYGKEQVKLLEGGYLEGMLRKQTLKVCSYHCTHISGIMQNDFHF